MATGQFDLLLINRIFHTSQDSGIRLVKELANAGCAAKLMLISNYADAQAEAVEAGAVRGFGKGALGAGTTSSVLKDALGLADG